MIDVVYGAVVGLATGVVTAYPVAVIQLSAKRRRNARLMARGSAGYKDCILVPLWIPGGVIGLVLGAIASAIWGELYIAAIAGAALPSLFMILTLVITFQQSRQG